MILREIQSFIVTSNLIDKIISLLTCYRRGKKMIRPNRRIAKEKYEKGKTKTSKYYDYLFIVLNLHPVEHALQI
jgi:hypothetical protein